MAWPPELPGMLACLPLLPPSDRFAVQWHEGGFVGTGLRRGKPGPAGRAKGNPGVQGIAAGRASEFGMLQGPGSSWVREGSALANTALERIIVNGMATDKPGPRRLAHQGQQPGKQAWLPTT